MKFRTSMTAMVFLLAVVLALPQGAWAKAVGRLTQVEGKVDLLKGGKLPAVPVKEGDEVEKGDVLRTKSLSRAQITFVDNSTVTVSPQTRIAVEEYMYDAAKGKRNALLEVFYGVVLTAVTKIYQTEQPDFKVKTHTAIMGIRGTQVGIRLAANSSQFMNFEGVTRISSNFPEVRGHVDLKAMEATEVKRGLPPTLPYEITPQDQKQFMRQLTSDIGQTAKVGNPGNAPPPAASAAVAGINPAGAASSLASSLTIVPVVNTTVAPPPPSAPTLVSYTFSLANFFPSGVAYTNTSGTFTNTNPNPVYTGNLLMGGNQVGTFALSSFAISTTTPISGNVPTGTLTVLNTPQYPAPTITVSGIAGGTLTGTMNMTAATFNTLNPEFRLSGPVTLTPSTGAPAGPYGTLTFTTNGTFQQGSTTVPTTGTWTQVNTAPAAGSQAAAK